MGKYDDILYEKRPEDSDHPPMTLSNRAAQFAPFDALTGFGGLVYETSRVTQDRLELTDDARQLLNGKLQFLESRMEDHPLLTITYFVQDLTKDGGSYRTVTSHIVKLLPREKELVLEDDLSIAFTDIIDLDGDLFPQF